MKNISIVLVFFGLLCGARQVFARKEQPSFKPCIIYTLPYYMQRQQRRERLIQQRKEQRERLAQKKVQEKLAKKDRQAPISVEPTKICINLPQVILTKGKLLGVSCKDDAVNAFETQVKQMSLPQDPTDTPYYKDLSYDYIWEPFTDGAGASREVQKNMISPEFKELYTKFRASGDTDITVARKIQKLITRAPCYK